MAIEDAAVLAQCLGQTPDDAAGALRQLRGQRHRRAPRARNAPPAATARVYHMGGAEAFLRSIALRRDARHRAAPALRLALRLAAGLSCAHISGANARGFPWINHACTATRDRHAADGVDRSGLRHDRRSAHDAAPRTATTAIPIISARPAAAPNSPPIPRKYLSPTSERRRAGARGHDLHLPDASGDPPDRPRRLPDLRHGAGAGDRHRRHRAQSRTRRHDAAVLDRAGADAAGLRAGDGRASRSARMPGSTRRCRTGCSSSWRRRWCCGPAGRSSSAAGSRSSRATSTCSR